MPQIGNPPSPGFTGGVQGRGYGLLLRMTSFLHLPDVAADRLSGRTFLERHYRIALLGNSPAGHVRVAGSAFTTVPDIGT